MNKKIMTAGILIIIIAAAAGIMTMKNKQTILPSHIDIDEETRVESDENGNDITERKENNYSNYDPMMLCGSWIRITSEGSETIDVPAPDKTEQNWTVEAMPEEISFLMSSEVNAYLEPVFRSCFNAQMKYHVCSAGGNGTGEESYYPEECTWRGIYDISGTTLALGLTNESADDAYYNYEIRSADIKEIHYNIQWTGSNLKLSLGNISAEYVPSTFEGNTDHIMNAYFSLGQPKNNEADFHNIYIEGGGKGNVDTVYGVSIPMTYSFEDNGSFYVELENGTKWTYDSWLCSDYMLTLKKGGDDLIYQDDYTAIISDNDKTFNYIPVSNRYELNGATVNDFIDTELSDLLSYGCTVWADTGSIIDPGEVSEPFPVSYNGIEFSAKVRNITDIDLPLNKCVICWYRFSSEKGAVTYDKGENLIGMTNEGITWGDDKTTIIERYDNLFESADGVLSTEYSIYNFYVDEEDLMEAGANILIKPTGYSQLWLGFTDNKLDSVTVASNELFCENAQYNMETADIRDADHGVALLTAERLQTVAENICTSVSKEFGDKVYVPVEMGPDSETGGNEEEKEKWEKALFAARRETGSIIIPWTTLFEYGSPELSPDGRAVLEKLLKVYSDAIKDHMIDISKIQICAYTRYQDRENSVKLTEQYAAGLSDEVKKMCGSNPDLADKIEPCGFGSTAYNSEAGFCDLSGSSIQIRFILTPEKTNNKGEASVTIYDPETTEHYYMDPEKSSIYEVNKDFAEKYGGTYQDDCYRIDAVDFSWKLPEGWHFGSDQELTALNGGDAREILISRSPIYTMVAFNDTYSSMADVRLYHSTDNYKDLPDEAAEDEARSLHRSYEAMLERDAEQVKGKFTSSGDSFKSEFKYSQDGHTYERKITYIQKDEVLLTLTEITQK